MPLLCLQAFQVVTRIPSVLMKSAAKQVESAGKILVQLTTGGAATSVVSDRSFAPSRSGFIQREGISQTPGTANTYQSQSHLTPPNIGVGSGDGSDDIGIVSNGGTIDVSCDRTGGGHDSKSHGKKVFSTIFRRRGGEFQSSRGLSWKNTC